ncbi:hypothetical protein [Cyanobacterium aponinum]|uniref:hypothetical protein n=1 Tax=Cyanobacterium aponinum TaxID=379064 RepID=UPI000C12C825|nr:hypothetical protein [Cyanobacterium aponinum]PHV63751.1 hypothetical protein CSQ80_04055 [Cyanobacterium aponinum IPPAS B-1201]
MDSKTPESDKDNLLIVNELKKITQKLNDIQSYLIENNRLNPQTKLLHGNLILISILLITGLGINFYLYKQQLKQSQKLEELNKLQGQILEQLNSSEQYEYQVVSPSDYIFEEEMNNYGIQGWKTAECRRATSGSYSVSASYECIMIRKR